MANRILVTWHEYPPIPDRSHDWGACFDGDEEDGPYGWGRTEEEAIADLMEAADGCPMCFATIDEDTRYCRACGDFV